MAHVSRLSDYVKGGVAQENILEGKLVSISTSGIRDELPNVRLAASGAVYPVFVAFVPPSNATRPINKLQYTANRLATIRSDVNTGWGEPVDAYTMYRADLSTFEAPVLESGMLVQLHRGGTYHVTSGCFIDTANIRVNGALVRAALDGTGRFELTTSQADAVGFVEEYNASKNYLTVTLKQ